MLKDWYSTDDLIKHGGLRSTYMVSYLCRSGILEPSLSRSRKRGLRRRFSFKDLLLARALAKLLDSGVSVVGLKNTLRVLRSRLRVDAAGTLTNPHVVIKDRRVYLFESSKAAIELTAGGQLAFHFVLESGTPIRKHPAELRQKRSRNE